MEHLDVNPSPPKAPTLSDQIYAELRRLAAWYIASEAPGHTLQPTALVHEAYLRLGSGANPDGLTRPQFMAFAAKVMRNVLVDHARSRLAVKRGGGGSDGREDVVLMQVAWRRTTLEIAESGMNDRAGVDVLALHEALEHLAQLSPRQASVVEARFFAGLSVAQAAEALGVSPRTVEADWSIARAWLARRLGLTGRRKEGGL